MAKDKDKKDKPAESTGQAPADDVAAAPQERSLSDKARELGRVVLWLDAPEAQDYPAAESYLSLIATPAVAHRLAGALKKAPQTTYKAKDILRSARLELLPRTNVHVDHDLKKVRAGRALSPILLVRGDVATDRPAQIADGYHRVCASYYVDENTDIPVRIVDLG